MESFAILIIILAIILISWLLSAPTPPSPWQLCNMVEKYLAEAGNNKEIRKQKINKLAIELKKYLFDDGYCKSHRESFGVLFNLISENKDIAEAVFGDFAALSQRETEIKNLPPPDNTGGCGSSCSGYAR